MRWRPGLGQVVAVGGVGLCLALAGAMAVVFDGTRRTVLAGADARRAASAAAMAGRVQGVFARAAEAARSVEEAAGAFALEPDTPDLERLESALAGPLIEVPALSWVVLTIGTLASDRASDGGLALAAQGRLQLSVSRDTDARGSSFVTRLVEAGPDGAFRIESWTRPMGRVLIAPSRRAAGSASDPTAAPTFTTPLRPSFVGRVLWSDLHWPAGEMDRPAPQRRVVVTALIGLRSTSSRRVGVVEVGLQTQALDRLVEEAASLAEGHEVFLCDLDGRLVTRPRVDASIGERSDALRYAPAGAPALAAALAGSAIRSVAAGAERAAERIVAGDAAYLLSVQRLDGTQGWAAGVLVPEALYLEGLTAARDRLVLVAIALLSIAAAAGLGLGWVVRRDLRGLVRETAALASLRFDPSDARSGFPDVASVQGGLETAKTAMRALSRYVPIELVRTLGREGKGPVLGSEPRDVTLLFTDIAGFTSIAETLEPNRLARALGAYLERAVGAIDAEGGTIDKFIGDAVMALFGAPTPYPDDARRACEAALRFDRAVRALEGEPGWEGLPPLPTRFGLHRDRVLVGHFGAPTRMSYTAIGDGVNVAARLESLNKAYGTRLLASATVRAAAGPGLWFRRLDRVAVKGRTGGLEVLELLGREGEVDPARLDRARRYEAALDAYLATRFREAREAFAALAEEGDPAARALLLRCDAYIAEPPPEGWDGVFVAKEK